jgi:hypothetical protein
MSTNDRIYNVTRRYPMRAKQALRGINNCAMAWVEHGKSVRDLTLAESIAARNEQASVRELPLPYVEIRGLKYEPTAGAECAQYKSRRLVALAIEFCKQSGA